MKFGNVVTTLQVGERVGWSVYS
ncbi:hypothetical protein J7E73_31255 [Paenibacillus albidus]|nr:hypothetical protein [Paenibacillus albidus]